MKTKEKLQSNNDAKKRLVLLDAHAIIHRAYHALPDFATSKGEPTGALYGLTSMILKIISDLRPDYIVAAYDLPKPTYRHEVFEGYKSGRVKADHDLVLQLEKSKKICEALDIPIYSKEGFEADDVLGTIVENLKEGDTDIIIASGDMDTLQLVSGEKVKVYTLKKGLTDTITYNERAVVSRFGFEPKLLPDYKGLRGDPSDNIPGIAGIGEKTASQLVSNFGTLENLYKILKKEPDKLSKAGLKARVIELLKNGEEEARFSKMLATIRRDAPIKFEIPKEKWSESVQIEKAKQLFNELEFRTMATRLQNTINGATGSLVKSEETNSKNIDPEELKIVKVALWVADSNKTNPTLDDILGFAKTDDFDKAKKIIFDEIKKRKSEFVFEEIEKPLIPVIDKMSEHGVLVNALFLANLDRSYTKELKEIEKKIWKESGEEFNISSPKQLAVVLFDKLGLSLKNHKKTGGGAKSTKESELERMQSLHPVIPLILEHRELSKLIGTYIEPIPKMLDKKSRLHSRFIQTGSATGRMASEKPNLQNIPITTERGRAIREAFIAPSGRKLVAFDYSQIELRIAAFLSGDSKLMDSFIAKEDIHTIVASHVFEVTKADVTKEMRRQAKVINFGILYGMGVNALKDNLGSDRKTAQIFYNAYFEKFPTLAEYIDRMKKEAHERGFTETIFGRRRYFEGIKSSIPYIRASAERMAVNAPIQGTQADLIKLAMNKINRLIKVQKKEGKINLILQIHDELIYEMDDEVISEAIIEIRKIMENILTREQSKGVPIVANVSVGGDWSNLVSY